ncbi:MAG: protein O-mannosyl-transferase family [Nitrospiria bacterium]
MLTLLPYLIFFTSFSVYLFTALPSIYWRDAPEFQAIGFLVDIAHPAGSPLYALVAKLFTFIPLGSIAFKVTLVSSFFGALIPVITYFTIFSILTRLSAHTDEKERHSQWIPIIALMTTLVFLFSNALWENATVPEVYTFQHFFTALFILIFLKTEHLLSQSKDKDIQVFRYFALLLFLLGLSLGAHAILVLYVPFLFLWVYFGWLRQSTFNTFKTCTILSFFFLIGFSVYLYLPIRSAQDPYYDWGNPETIENLLIHTSDRKDAAYHFMVPQNVMPLQLSMYSRFYIEDFSWIGIILGFTGFFYLFFRKEKRLLLFLLILFLPPFLFFIRYWGETSAFISNLLIFDLFVGIGFWAVYTTAPRFFEQKQINITYLRFGVVLVLLQMVLLVSHHFQENRNSNYWKTRLVTKNLLNDLPPNAIVVSTLTWFMLSYLQQAEGYRPDVSIVSLSSFLAPDFFSKLNQAKFQNIIIPDNTSSSKTFGSAFLSENVHAYPIYWETAGMHDYLVEKYLIPEGFFLRVGSEPAEIDQTDMQAYFKKLGNQIQVEHISEDREERLLFAEVLAGLGNFFMTRQAYKIARDHFHWTTLLMPNDPNYLNALGSAEAHLEKYQVAEGLFLKSITIKPEDYIPYLNLAELYYHQGIVKKSETYLKTVLTLHPNHQKALFLLGKISMDTGNNKEGLRYFQEILKFNPDNQEAKAQVALLKNES